MAEFVEDAVIPALLEMNEHNRTNHIHREGIAQALRIHEANANAAKEYHRTEVKLGNDQHARAILQSRLQHEEDIDLEKRGAIRENIRDEWMLLSDKAETVFIVNTLVLGTAFAMLIEGSLPDSVTLQMHTLTVAYFCALSASVCLLLVSVRFAMILRFRVGSTIVEAMRKAIDCTAQRDAQFRQDKCYRKWNRPKVTVPACGDEWHPASRQVMPYTWHLDQGRRAMPSAEKEEEALSGDERPPGFILPPTLQRPPELYVRGRGADGNQQGAYADLNWLNKDTGFALDYMGGWRRRHKCQTKPTGKGPKDNTTSDHFDPVVQPSGGSSLLNAGESGKLTIYTQSTHDSLDSSEPEKTDGNGSATDGEKTDDDMPGDVFAIPRRGVSYASLDSDVAEYGEDDGAPSSPSGGQDLVQEELDKFESEYRRLLRQRQLHNAELQDTLQRIRDEYCKPWDRNAQLLFFSGTFALLCASCCLVFGRFGYRQAAVPEGALTFPAAPLAAIGFCVPILVTFVALVYAEVPVQKFRKMDLSAHIFSDALGRKQHGNRKDELGKQEMASSYIGRSLVVLMVFNFAFFVVTAGIIGPPAPLAALIGHGQHQMSGLKNATSLAGSALNLTVLRLAPGAAWPRFWEPSGASFWPSHSSLLIAGGNLLVELRLGKDQRPLPRITRQVASPAMLVDVCILPGPKGEELLVASDDATFSVLDPSESLLQDPASPLLGVDKLFDSPYAGKRLSMHGHALDCRGVAGVDSSAQLWVSANESPWPVLVGAAVSSNDLDNGAGTRSFSAASQWPTAWLLTDPSLAVALTGEHGSTSPDGVVVEGIGIVGANVLLLLTVAEGDESAVHNAPAQMLALIGAAGRLSWWSRLTSTPGASKAPAHKVAGQPWRALAVDVLARRIFLVSAGPEPQVAFADMPPDW